MASALGWVGVSALLGLISIGCNDDGTGSASQGPPSVTVALSVSKAFVGEVVTLQWSSINAVSCTASGAWNGSRPLNGTQSLTPTVPGTAIYTLTCVGTNGATASGSATLTVASPSVSVTSTFTPAQNTISTSEGAPYGETDVLLGPSGVNINTGYGYGPTKVLRAYICLNGEIAYQLCSQQKPPTGPLPSTFLDAIDAGLASVDGSGARLIVRFIYNFGPIGAPDAPLDVIGRHLDQLAPILLRHKDLILALEAGFIGTWGEWHDSTNGNDTAGAHKAVLDKELAYFGNSFPILVRYPGDLIAYLGNNTQANLGLHDDYYASSADDGGSWLRDSGGLSADQLMAYAARVSTASLFVGEFGAVDPTLQGCSALDDYSYRFHLQSIALALNPDVASLLQQNGCITAFLNKVGTRIEIQDAAINGDAVPGGTLNVTVTLANTGYGRVVRARPANLVFLSGRTVVNTVPLPLASLDVRQLISSRSPAPVRFQFSVQVPANVMPAQLSLALSFPDPSPSLAALPQYALPLNSLDRDGRAIFDSTTGYNTIAILDFGAAALARVKPLSIPALAGSASVGGTWAGTFAVPGAPAVTVRVEQAGAGVRGTVVAEQLGVPFFTGTLTGTVVGRTLTFAVEVPAGTLPMQPGCSGELRGSVDLVSGSGTLVGSAWAGTVTCLPHTSTVDVMLRKATY